MLSRKTARSMKGDVKRIAADSDGDRFANTFVLFTFVLFMMALFMMDLPV
jgi:hypothetical protein